MTIDPKLYDEISRVTIETILEPHNKRILMRRIFGERRVFKIRDQWYFNPAWPWSIISYKCESWTAAVRMAGAHVKAMHDAAKVTDLEPMRMPK